MTFDPHALKLYVDGSCKRRNKQPGPGPGGWAMWAEYPDSQMRDDELIDSKGYFLTTNNRMEMMAMIFAYEWIEENTAAFKNVTRIQIITDSEYVEKHMGLAHQWRANGWCNADGKAIENPDLWKALINIRARCKKNVSVKQTKGKKTGILKAVDKSAKAAADNPTETDYRFHPGKVGRKITPTQGAARLFPAADQEATINIFLTTVMPRQAGRNKIKFQVLENEGAYRDSFYAFATPEVGNSLSRHHSYRVRFNGNPKNPEILENLGEVSIAGASATD